MQFEKILSRILIQFPEHLLQLKIHIFKQINVKKIGNAKYEVCEMTITSCACLDGRTLLKEKKKWKDLNYRNKSVGPVVSRKTCDEMDKQARPSPYLRSEKAEWSINSDF